MKQILSVIGAGGKTTLVHRLAEEFQKNGKTVLLTTTTHMAVEPDTDLSDDPEQIIARMRTTGSCMAGVRCGKEPDKMQKLSEGTMKRVMEAADIVLVEADGAKHHNVKFPREGEPVIRPETTEIILVMGLAALGKPAGEAVFRLEQLQEFQRRQLQQGVLAFVTQKEDLVDMELLDFIVEEGYRKPLADAFPEIPLRICYAIQQGGRLTYLSREEAKKLI